MHTINCRCDDCNGENEQTKEANKMSNTDFENRVYGSISIRKGAHVLRLDLQEDELRACLSVLEEAPNTVHMTPPWDAKHIGALNLREKIIRFQNAMREL